jgi:hypothetical protein
MPGQRRPGRRSRESWGPRIAGLTAVVLIAGVGAGVYVLKFRPSDRHPARLPTTVLSKQAVGMVATALSASPGHSGRSLVQLLGPGGVPVFTPLSPAAAASSQGSPQWTADLMTGNGWIFIYLQDGNCLAAGSRARLIMQHCDLGAAQRWRRVGGALSQDGHQFYQYANVADGKCLSEASSLAGAADASLATCRPGQPPSQMIALWWSTQ